MLNQNAKFHELIAQLLPDHPYYAKCVAAQKFDLGDQDKLNEMADAAWDSAVRPPYSHCLFQFKESCSDTVHFYYVEDHSTDEYFMVSMIRFAKFPDLGKWDGPRLKVVFVAKVGDKELRTGAYKDDEMKEQIPSEEMNQHYDKEDAYAWTVLAGKHLVHCFAVLACSNVERKDNVPPKFINAKRMQKGKQPFFSFWTVHLKSETCARSNGSGGSHASPRLHFRRGHIRRVGENRTVWVTQHLVGDKSLGFAAKDYAVSRTPTKER